MVKAYLKYAIAPNFGLVVNFCNWFFVAFPVTRFEGRKRVLLTNTCVTGGKNPVLGIMYIVVGSLAVIFAVAFYILDAHIKPGYETNSWNIQ